MKKLLAILTLITVSLIGCKKQEDIYLPVSSDFLQGQWNDDFQSVSDLGGSLYNLNFKKKSFTMNVTTYSDYVFITCNYISAWNEYVKGNWSYSNDLLILNGYYCDENYNKLTVSPCQQVIDTGKFYMEFNNVYYCNDTLVLQNTSQGLIKLKRE